MNINELVAIRPMRCEETLLLLLHYCYCNVIIVMLCYCIVIVFPILYLCSMNTAQVILLILLLSYVVVCYTYMYYCLYALKIHLVYSIYYFNIKIVKNALDLTYRCFLTLW
jgi:hypothetical protein